MKRGKKSKGHIPERTCVACRAKRPKRELIRLVRTPEKTVLVDESGKRNGRGAYLCPRRACWERALKQGSLERALKTTLTEENIAALQAHAAHLPAEAQGDEKQARTPRMA
ncbi:MAG: RNase P modulator RnpM [Anaerolineae bacterium]